MGALHTSQCYVRQSGKDSKGKTMKNIVSLNVLGQIVSRGSLEA